MHQVLSKELPVGWTEKIDEEGKTFYLNEYSVETTRERPFMPALYYWIKRPHEPECYHIMVKHAESRNPSSWRQEVVTRSKRQALILAKRYRRLILSKRKTFQELARLYSDCPSARFNGHLGIFRSGQSRHHFTSLVLNLRVGHLSGPIESPSGIHLLWRTC